MNKTVRPMTQKAFIAKFSIIILLLLLVSNLSAGEFVNISDSSVATWRNSTSYLSMDIDGDNQDELVEVWNNNGFGNAAVKKYIGNEFINISNNRVSNWRINTTYLAMDVDGNNKDELIEVWNNNGYGNAAVKKYIGNEFINISNNTISNWRYNTTYLVMDVDADGCDELIEIWNNNGYGNAAVKKYINEKFVTVSNNEISNWRDSTSYLATDVNGDGREELVEVWNNNGFGNAAVKKYIGGKFVNISNDEISNWRDNTSYLSMDVEGDGRDELIEVWNNNGFGNAAVKKYVSGKYINVSNNRISHWRYNTKYISINTSGYLLNNLLEIWQNQTQAIASSKVYSN